MHSGLVIVGIGLSYSAILTVQFATRMRSGDGVTEILGAGWFGRDAVNGSRDRTESNAPILSDSLLSEQQESN